MIGDFVIDGDRLVRYTGHEAFAAVPDTVTVIGYLAFSGCKSLTGVTIPEGVTDIGYLAFIGCSSLKSITLPESVTAIGNRAFSGCHSLTGITIPGNVTSIGDMAFRFCESLASITIPESVTAIGNEAFSGCHSLKCVTIPDTVACKWYDVFGDCRPTEINVNTPALLPEEMKPAAMAGYANNPDKGGTRRKRAHFEYIQAKASELLDKAFECPALMRIILENKLVKPETALKYLKAAAERNLTEITAMLLEYTKDSAASGDADGWKL